MPLWVTRWRRFDTKEVYLGSFSRWRWPGPQYHTVPSWAAIVDPFSATDTDWNINPVFLDRDNWDMNWWPPEFIHRERGPLFDLPTQVGFFRRARTAMIAAAAEWDTAATFRQPPGSAVFGIALSTGPRDTMRVVAGRVDGASPPAIFTAIASRPVLVGIEMIPTSDVEDGAASRTRFGTSPPRPLAALAASDIALSDPLLVKLDAGAPAPASLEEALDRMYGTTRLHDPRRMAVAWEVYGLSDGDTVDVALRFIRRDDSGAIGRLLSNIGIGRAGEDSLVIRWREPRGDDRPATVDGGWTIRFRTLAVDVSNLSAGEYSLEIVTERAGSASAVSRRTFEIRR